MGKDAIYNHDGSLRMMCGWKVRRLHKDDMRKEFKDLGDGDLEVEEIFVEKSITTLSFVGHEGRYWIGWFVKAPKQFKVGDRVRYIGKTHSFLKDKVLKVTGTQTFGYSDCLFLLIGDDTTHHNADYFKLADEFPNFKEILLGFCNNGTIDSDTRLYFDIQNDAARKAGQAYTKNDLMAVLRTLEYYQVRANIEFDSELSDVITVTISGDDVMEELANNTPATLPLSALEELCCKFEVFCFISGEDDYYVLGHDMVVYETRKTNLSSMQNA